MARTSSRKAQAQTIDYAKAENLTLGSFMKRVKAAGLDEIILTDGGDVRKLFRCLNIMKGNTVKFLNNELSFEELAEEHDRSFGYWTGTATDDYDSFA